MSRTENHFGTITEICDTVEGFEAKYDLAVKEYLLTKDDEDCADYIVDEEFHYHKKLDMMFKIDSSENEYGHCDMIYLSPQKWAFAASFYNGGGDISEVIDEMIEDHIGEVE